GGSAPSASTLAIFMKEGREKGRHSENAVGNCVTVRDFEKQVRCQTEFQGQVVHAQWMRREETSDRPANNGQQRQQQVEEQNQAPRR
ncbi:MAG TPA: hypothetical protein VGK61_10835, partial [Planctomycetota bacterium]